MARVRYRGSLETVEGYVCLLVPEAIGVKLGDTYRVPVKGTSNRSNASLACSTFVIITPLET